MTTATPLLPTLFWLGATALAFQAGVALQRRLGGSPLVNPVLMAIVLLAAALSLSHTAYAAYFQQVQLIHFLLGPTTVALAIPLVRHARLIRASLLPIALAIVLGALISALLGTALVAALGGTREVAMSMAPKAATTPIAMGVAQQLGGIPALSAVFAILGGILSAVLAPLLLPRLGLRDWRAYGLAAGTAGSGIGAAQAARQNDTAAAFAALAIGLNGLITALLAPWLALIWR